MNPLMLIACLSPIAIIWIVMKIAVWMLCSQRRKELCRSKNHQKPHGPYVADAYADVDEEEEEYGDRTDYR